MIEFRPYIPTDLLLLDLQPAQELWRDLLLLPDYAAALAVPGRCWTAIAEDRVVGCGGLIDYHPGVAKAWALISCAAPRLAWPRAVRRMRALIDAAGCRRIEADVADGFVNGYRLMALLGFEVECLRRKFGFDGSDAYLFARVAP